MTMYRCFWEPDEDTDWYLICKECDEEFWVGQSCSCGDVDLVDEGVEEAA